METERYILIRYCEIHLKGHNRNYFIGLLEKNIAVALTGIECELKRMQGRFAVCSYAPDAEEGIVSRLKKVAGIHTLSLCEGTNADLESISELALKVMDGKRGTFKVDTKRADKNFPMNSLEVSCELGGRLLDRYAPQLEVDVVNPQITLNVDIRENGRAFVFCGFTKCMGGMPVGSGGNGTIMISGGIDSPVACYMMAKRGMRVSAVHFHSFPYTGEGAKQKVVDLCKLLSPYTCGLDLYVVSFTEIQEAIHRSCPEEMMITMMRRFMFSITERIASSIGSQAIITGESLGQVASQTVESITTSNAVVTMPIFRPLIGFDKLEIIEIAERIGTFETSIQPFEDCCTVFLPKHPLIKPKLERVEEAEKALDVEALIASAMGKIEKIRL